MSLLNFIGGNLRQSAPQRPEATTAKADVSIHAHLSTPAQRRGSLDGLAPIAQRAKQAPARAQTDSFPPNSSSPLSSLKSDKKNTSWRNLGKVLRSSPAASKTSLLSQEAGSETGPSTPPQPHSNAKGRSHSKRYILPRKKSTSIEQEWTEVGKDSSDDDDTLGARQEEGRQPDKALEESVIVVEDSEVLARRLKEELADTRKKLEGATDVCSALKERIDVLERENKALDDQRILAGRVAEEERAELSLAHAKELDDKHRELEELQQSLDIVRCDSREKGEKVELLVQENSGLRCEVASLEERSELAKVKIEVMRKEVEASSKALRTLKDTNAATLDESRKEKQKLVDQVDQLWNQLEDLQRLSKERDQQIQGLRATEQTTKDAFRKVQTTVAEKDRTVEDLLRRNVSLTKEVEGLRGRIDGMEMDAVETQNASQRLLAKTRENHEQELMDAKNKIKSLQDEVSSYMSVTQDLRSSFTARRAEVEKALKLAERRAAEIQRLQHQLSDLQKTLTDKNQELIDSAASRESQAHLEETIRTLRERIAKVKDEQTHNSRQSQLQATSAINEAKLQTSRIEKELDMTREKLSDLRKRYDSIEQSRKMLRDQLMRREDDNRKGRASDTSGGTFLSSLLHDAVTPSSNEQVYNLLQMLNYQIFQTAALLADSDCSNDRPSPHPSRDGSSTADLIDPETMSVLGPHLLSLVRSQSALSMAEYNPLPLQTALQATLTCCASRIMTAWYPGHWDLSDFLSAIHLRIRTAEGITASETWKTTTRAKLKPTTATVLLAVEFMSECLVTVFQYAGWTSASLGSSAPGGPKDHSVKSLLRANREKLSALARLALRLNVILDNVKPQLEPLLIEPGSKFDRRVMECEDLDTGSDGGSEEDEDAEVVCTSEIGLRKASESGELRDWGRKRDIVLKPKVILKSSFDL